MIEDDADVLRHRHDHLPVVLGLRLLAALEADPRQLRHAFDELRDLGAELGAQLLEIGLGVLDDVVKERSGDRLLVEMKLRADPCDTERVVDELLARPAGLPGMRALGELERATEQLLVDVRVVRLDLGDQLLDAGLRDAALASRTLMRVQCTERGFVTLLAGEEGRRMRANWIGPMSNLRRWWRRRERAAPRTRHARCARAVSPRPRLTVTRRAASAASSEKRSERLRLEELAAARVLCVERKLTEDAPRLRSPGRLAARARAPRSARSQLLVALGRVEDPPDDELRCDRAVPVVLLQAERDVEQADREQPIELRALTERNRAPGVASVLTHAKAKMLAVADGRGSHGLRRRDEQGDVRVAETERRKALELLRQVEREIARRDDRVHGNRLEQVVRPEVGVGVRREVVGERRDVRFVDRQPRGGTVTSEALEVTRARRERAVQVEARDRPSRALPARRASA